METVAALPDDDAFHEFIDKHRIETVVEFSQDDTYQPIRIDTLPLQTIDTHTFGNRMIDFEGLYLQAATTGETATISGSATINKVDYTIHYSPDERQMHFTHSDYPDLPPSHSLTHGQLVELLASGIIARYSKDVTLEDVLIAYDAIPSDADKLPTLIYALGSINGEASRRTTAQFSGTDDQLIAARLTSFESPRDNARADTLSLYEAGEWVDASHLVQNSQHHHEENERTVEEYALRGTERDDIATVAQRIYNGDLDDIQHGLVRHEASGASIRETRLYALTCVKFLDAYLQARRTETK